MRKLGLIAALLVLVVVASCLGVKTRDNVLLPAARDAYGDIYHEVVRGLLDGKVDGDLTDEQAEVLIFSADSLKTALKDGDRVKIASVDWEALRPWAIRGIQDKIDDGEIAETVAASLFHRVEKFTESLEVLAQRL